MGEAVSSTQRPEAPEPAPISDEAWEGLEQTEEFKQLVRARWRFVVPATIFFLVYYFLLPILNGTATIFMRTEVIGHINIAYLFALSQFVVAWLLAWLYIRRANNIFDPLAEKVRERARQGRIPAVKPDAEREVGP
jgi:uncharacterized membrane protein (DUF485 family)